MSAVSIDSQYVPSPAANITAVTYSTLVPGSGNGVVFNFSKKKFIYLKNDTGGPAVFTLLLKEIPELDDIGLTPANPTVTIATGNTYEMAMADAYRNENNQMTIECDVAGKVAVMELP